MQQRIGPRSSQLPRKPQRFLDHASVRAAVEAAAFHGGAPPWPLSARTGCSHLRSAAVRNSRRSGSLFMPDKLSEEMMDTDRIEGAAKSMVGKVEKAAGDAFSDKQT